MVKEQTESFFGADSPLRNANATDNFAFKYEPRQQQVDMAYAVADAFDNHENLLKTNQLYQEICAIQNADHGDFDAHEKGGER